MELRPHSFHIQLQRLNSISDAEIIAYAQANQLSEADVHAPGAYMRIIDAIVANR